MIDEEYISPWPERQEADRQTEQFKQTLGKIRTNRKTNKPMLRLRISQTDSLTIKEINRQTDKEMNNCNYMKVWVDFMARVEPKKNLWYHRWCKYERKDIIKEWDSSLEGTRLTPLSRVRDIHWEWLEISYYLAQKYRHKISIN